MQRLNLAKNELSIIPHEALAELNYLEHLELSENPISEIKPGDFNGILLLIRHIVAKSHEMFEVSNSIFTYVLMWKIGNELGLL